MAGKSKSDIARLKSQAEKINTIFADAGFEQIEPDIVQPADIFLEQIGENVRARTYVFSDLEGESLCLRPDLTIPAARYYLDHVTKPGELAKYRYLGPAFRFQFSDHAEAQQREFEQAGIEIFGGQDVETAEAEVLSLALKAVEAAGLKKYRVRTGDLGFFSHIIDQLDMPSHWAASLKSKFWRTDVFKKVLERLDGRETETALPDIARTLPDLTIGEAVIVVEGELNRRGVPAHGLRSVEEIALRLREKAIDASLPPLSSDVIKLISESMEIECSLEQAAEQIENVAGGAGLDISGYLDVLNKRTAAFKKAGVPLVKCHFSGEFGRNLEYYTGFVFQVEALGVSGLNAQIAGGGRYDKLLSDLGAEVQMGAVGCAVHTERLLAALLAEGGSS